MNAPAYRVVSKAKVADHHHNTYYEISIVPPTTVFKEIKLSKRIWRLWLIPILKIVHKPCDNTAWLWDSVAESQHEAWSSMPLLRRRKTARTFYDYQHMHYRDLNLSTSRLRVIEAKVYDDWISTSCNGGFLRRLWWDQERDGRCYRLSLHRWWRGKIILDDLKFHRELAADVENELEATKSHSHYARPVDGPLYWFDWGIGRRLPGELERTITEKVPVCNFSLNEHTYRQSW